MGNEIEEMESDVEESSSRRKFLKTTGKFAIYTPPALMVMNKASAKKIAKSGGPVKKRPSRKKKRVKRKKRRLKRRYS